MGLWDDTRVLLINWMVMILQRGVWDNGRVFMTFLKGFMTLQRYILSDRWVFMTNLEGFIAL